MMDACDNDNNNSSNDNSSMAVIHCDDYLECSDTYITHFNSNPSSVVCCTAAEACYNINNITNVLDVNNSVTDINNNVSIRCDGMSIVKM